MSEIAICYEPERLLPKKRKPIIQVGSVRSTMYVSRRTRFNMDFSYLSRSPKGTLASKRRGRLIR